MKLSYTIETEDSPVVVECDTEGKAIWLSVDSDEVNMNLATLRELTGALVEIANRLDPKPIQGISIHGGTIRGGMDKSLTFPGFA